MPERTGERKRRPQKQTREVVCLKCGADAVIVVQGVPGHRLRHQRHECGGEFRLATKPEPNLRERVKALEERLSRVEASNPLEVASGDDTGGQ